MRIRVLSDLHREFGHVVLPRIAADVVVLAGDIDRSTRGVAWAREAFADVPVLYIAGNHEHYEERIGRLHEELREAAVGSNVTILENDIFELNGYQFSAPPCGQISIFLGIESSPWLLRGRRRKG